MENESVKHRFRKIWRQRIDIKFVTSAVFLVTYTDKRNTGKALYALLF